MRKIGIGYCRVSTEGQEENTSLEEQERKIRAFAESQGIEIVGMFLDVASGGSLNRQGYQAAINMLNEKKIDCFLVAKFDRAHRHQENLLKFERELREKDIAFLSVAELLDSSSPTGRLMFQILGCFAEFERNIINERTRDGRKAKLAKEEYAGGRPPMGYDASWNIKPQEAEMVKNIFSLYLKEKSLGRTKSKITIFSRQALHVILTNRAYLGEYCYNGRKEQNEVIVKGHHDAIISQNVFGRVQKALRERNKRYFFK